MSTLIDPGPVHAGATETKPEGDRLAVAATAIGRERGTLSPRWTRLSLEGLGYRHRDGGGRGARGGRRRARPPWVIEGWSWQMTVSRAFWSLLGSHLSFRSVWMRNAVRGGAGLALRWRLSRSPTFSTASGWYSERCRCSGPTHLARARRRFEPSAEQPWAS